MHQRELPFAVQRFGYGAGHGRNSTKAVIGKVGAVSRIYTDQGESPSSGHKESAQPKGGRYKKTGIYIIGVPMCLSILHCGGFPSSAQYSSIDTILSFAVFMNDIAWKYALLSRG